MKFLVKAANGAAGEYFFAYMISYVLKWPCRLLDIDIGVDAQVEVLDIHQNSTGKFVAFQIKAKGEGDDDTCYVTEAQLKYWKELQLPVFIALVHLAEAKMYIHRVALNKSYHVTPEGKIRIDFDLTQDFFQEATAELILQAANEAGVEKVTTSLDGLNEEIDDIRLQIDAMQYGNLDHIKEIVYKREGLRRLLSGAEQVATAVTAGHELVSVARGNLQDVFVKLAQEIQRQAIHVDNDDDNELKRFIREMRP